MKKVTIEMTENEIKSLAYHIILSITYDAKNIKLLFQDINANEKTMSDKTEKEFELDARSIINDLTRLSDLIGYMKEDDK